jgi:hypothetical protein
MWTKEDNTGGALAKRSFNGGLPGITGHQIPFIQPTGYSPVFQFVGEFLDQRLVSAVMRQKRMIMLLLYDAAAAVCVFGTHGAGRISSLLTGRRIGANEPALPAAEL